MEKNIINIFAFSLFIMISACNNSGKTTGETPTRGEIKISVDESYKLLMESESYTFQALYKNAKIHVSYKTEVECFEDLLNDSVRFIVVNRKLTTNEDQYLRAKQFVPTTTKIAYDALAFIVNKENPDSIITYEQIKQIFSGNISKWQQINPKSSLGDMKIIFDNNKSGNVRYIQETFVLNNKFPLYCYAVNSNDEVINQVEKNKNMMGIIGVNWISDHHDSTTIDFLKRVKVVGVEPPTGASACKPYQGYIAEKSYPLTREVYTISREPFSGLGTGFVAFIAGDQGQRIVRLSGLVPATMPIRLVEIKK